MPGVRRGFTRPEVITRPAAVRRPKTGTGLGYVSIASTLHLARVFHKDFYLCHYFLDMSKVDRSGCRLILIIFIAWASTASGWLAPEGSGTVVLLDVRRRGNR